MLQSWTPSARSPTLPLSSFRPWLELKQDMILLAAFPGYWMLECIIFGVIKYSAITRTVTINPYPDYSGLALCVSLSQDFLYNWKRVGDSYLTSTNAPNKIRKQNILVCPRQLPISSPQGNILQAYVNLFSSRIMIGMVVGGEVVALKELEESSCVVIAEMPINECLTLYLYC
ncbi:uncharacterized protein LOC103718295 isoform X2 [Phoenix dactylifera]|uniref:Uncharacterized protein LOC103718295 isoform X2 n=1 Tax=Phoenix dactylifera TaxID=42345 RepID=A0A8B9ADI4_PHODC|nr:uncharacterized protein LOC103718295 isoform X2 [Phoenix dactylifera]XP_038984515.1 uncharacterized protein LOC103718295 isoform X2 [Phoenix dactylifera]